MDFKELIQTRRSHRKFTEQEIDGEAVRLIMRAGLMSPTSKGSRSWQFVVVDDKLKIEQMADAKDMGSQFMKGAPLAVAVCGKPQDNDCWIEDCSCAAMAMLLQAEDLGLGGCWVQMRARSLADGTPAQQVLSGILDLPEDVEVLCVLAFGHKADERKPQLDEKLKWEQVKTI